MSKLKVNDQVIVITGSDKGKIGKIEKIVKFHYATVEGINLKRKSVKKNSKNKDSEIGFKDISLPVHLSNLAIYNSNTGKKDKIIFKIKDKKKVRTYKFDNKLISS